VVANGRVVKWIAVVTAVNIGIVLALTQCALFDDIRPAPALQAYETPYGSYLAARHATNLNDPDAAADYYRTALRFDPDNTILIERTFVSEVSAGNLDAAARLADKLVKAIPDATLANLVIGIHALRDTGYARARAAFGRIKDNPAAIIAARLGIAYAHFSEGDLAAAREALSELDSFSGAEAFLLYHRAVLNDLSGKPQEALEHFRNAVRLTDGEAQRIVQAYGNHLIRMDRRPEAQALFQEYLRKNPDNPVMLRELERVKRGEAPVRAISNASQGIAETLYGIASNLAEGNAVEVPVFYLQLALALDPRQELALSLLGERLEVAGRNEQAINAYKRIPETSPVYPDAQRQIAQNLVILERPAEAISVLKAALNGTRSDIGVLSALGDVHRGEEKYEDAIAAYDKAIALIGKPGAHDWIHFYARGVASERAGKWSAAEDDLKRSLALRPDNPEVMNYLAYSWVDRGENIDEALAMLKKAVALRPEDGFIVDSLGWAFYKLGNYAEALRYLEQAIQLEPGEATINDHLGDAYWKVGRRQEARFQWQHALDLGPEEGDEPVIRRKLEKGLVDEAPTPVAPATRKTD
jgi:tetratricopeptide (TPR) repeat protein